jgi:Arc/MetJ-type ribon-helix-helix transcriptional regulator
MAMAADLEKTEKITVNLGVVDLGEIDLLVREGFFANRADFIRIAIRAQLATRATALEQTVARKTLVLGTQRFSRRDPSSSARRGSSCRFACSGWRRSTATSRRSWRGRRSRRWRCSGRSAPARR